VLVNDSDTDTTDTLSVSGLDTSGTAGLVANNSDGTFGYDPNGQFESLAVGETATDSFKYTVTDGNGGTDTATVTVTISGVNDDPTAVDDDGGSTDFTSSFTTANVLANDSDPDTSDTLSVSGLDTSGTAGLVTNNSDGTFGYDPNSAFDSLAGGASATDTFEYTVTDGQGGTDTATVTVTVTRGNTPPVAVDDSAATDEDTPATVSVLANDSDSDSGTPSVQAVDSSGTIGTVTNNGSDVDYDPNGQFESLAVGETATDSFRYTISDGQGGTDTATVTVTISGANDAPTAAGDDVDSTDAAASFTTANVLVNDSDPDTSDTLSVSALDTSGTAGLVANNSDGTFGYDPNGQFESLAVGETATDSFKYTVTDGNGGTDTATVTVTISGVNDDPTAVDDDGGVTAFTASFTTANVLANDSDPDTSDTLSVSGLDTSGTAGLVTNNSDGTFGYDPNGAFDTLAGSASATDTFKYTVTDGQGGTDTATVTVTVTRANVPPVAVDDNAATDEDTPATVSVLANDSDSDSGTPSVQAVNTSGTIGTVTNNGSDVDYDPNGQFESLAVGETATDSFRYTISDGQGGTDTATVTVTISGVNDAPTAVGDDVDSTDAIASFTTANVLVNDSDPDTSDTLSVSALDTSGTAGLVANNSDGTFGYDPNGQFESLAVGETATDSFKYTVTDGQGGTDTATVTVTISGVNEAPTAVGDNGGSTGFTSSFTTANVLANDSDPDTSDTLSVSALDTSGTAGLVTNNSDGTFGYDPNGAFDSLAGSASATDTFKYSVTDGQGGTDTATVTVTVTRANTPPVAVDDSAATDEDTPTTISVLANDSDSDSGTPSVQAVDSSGTIGTVTNNGSDVDYDPNGQFESLAVGETATDSFRYTISDGQGGTDTATVTVTISGANDAPTAVGDDVDSTDAIASFTTANVLVNDSDTDTSDTLSVSALDTSGTAGLVSNNSDGTFGYDPNGQFESLAVGETATDSFKYTVTDGNGGTDTATVTVTISGVNEAPTAVDDDGGVTAFTASFTTANVLANDSDPDTSDTLSVSGLDTSGTAGLVTNNSDGTFGYDPNGAFDTLAGSASATDTFKYTVADGQGGTDTATVTVTVTRANTPPVAVDDNAATDEDTPATFSVLANDSDSDSGTPSVQAVDSSGTIGTVTNNGSDVDYDPNGQFESLAVGETATDSFRYTISDGQGGTDTATVTVTISGANDAPTAVGDDVDSTDAIASFTTTNVLVNDSDTDTSDTLSVSALDTSGTAGLVANNSDGTFGYDPNGQFEGLAVGETETDSFKYTVTDGNGGTDTATVTVTISGVNDDPTAVDDDGGSTGFTSSFTTANVLANDSDPDTSDTLSVSGLDTSGTAGLVTNNSDGTFGYDPNGAFDSLAGSASATDTFKYTVTDGQGGTDTATVTVTVTRANVPPVAVDDNAATDEDTPATFSVLANDSDSDSGTPSVQAVNTSGTVGTVTNNGSDVDYDPNGQFESLAVGETATDSFRYTISDGQGGTDTATVTVTISGVNDAPTAVGDDVDSTDAIASFTTANVLVNDSDPDTSDTLSVSALDTSGTAGLVANNSDGTFGYDPNGQFESLAVGETATDSFKYTVTDGQGGTDTATVTVTISGVNEAPTAVGDNGGSTGFTSSFTTANVLTNDSDPDVSDTLSVSALDTSGTAGLVTNNSDGTFGYDPNSAFDSLAGGASATDTFKYTVTDGQGGTDTATVTVTVTRANVPPVAVDDSAATDEDTPTTISVLANDSDSDSGVPDVQAVDTSGTIGTVTNNGSDVDYDPNGQFESLAVGETATDSFRYTISDGQGGTDTATVTVTISGANDAPTAAGDDVDSTDAIASFTTANVLVNDSDTDTSDTLSVSALDTSGTAGLVANNSDGTFGYDPNGQFESLAVGETATDSFKYTVTDGNGGTDTATVTVTISGVNEAPTAVDDDGGVTAFTASFTTANVLVNDSDPDTSDTLSVSGLDTSGTAGLVTNNSDGTFGYDPNGAFDTLAGSASATDTFKYTVADGQGGTDTATVTVTVTRANTPPVAVDDNAATDEDTPATFSVLANDSDSDSGTPSVQAVDTSGTIGTVTNNGSDVDYDPNGQFESLAVGETATDSFKYTISDGQGGTDTATVTVTISGANDEPTALDDDGGATGFTSSFTTANVLANDSDTDTSDTLSVSGLDTSGTAGLVSNNSDGTFGYDPNSAFDTLAGGASATDTFKYTVTDGEGGTDTATVTVTVTRANTPPVAVDDTVATDEDTPATFSVLANDSDSDSGTPSVQAVDSSGTIGTVTNNGSDVDYDPNGQFESLAVGETATDSFRYTISDGQGGTDTATVTVTISGVNDAPTTVDDDGGSTAHTASFTTANVLGNDSDPDTSDTLSVSALDTSGTAGLVANNSDGTFGYDPNGAFDSLIEGTSATDTFRYTVTDGQGGTDTATVTVTITNDFTSTAPDSVSDLVVWLDADDPTTITDTDSDDDVDVWADKSGQVNNASQVLTTSQPEIVAAGINGRTAIGFDGILERLDIADDTDINSGGPYAGKTVMMAFRTGSDVTSRQVLYEQGGQNRGLNFYIDNGEIYLGGWNLFETAWGPSFAKAAISANTTYVSTFVFDQPAGTVEGFIDGVSIGSVAGASFLNAHAQDIGIGAINESARFHDDPLEGILTFPDFFFFQGLFGEFVYYNRALTSGEQSGVENYLQTRWQGLANNLPVAVDDTVATDEDTPATFSVVANDSDSDGGPLGVQAVDTSGTIGTVTNNGSDVGYDPNGQFESLAVGETATDSFKYTMTDGQGGSDTATVTVTISGVNDDPTAVGDNGGSTSATSSFTTANVLANDSDLDTSDTLSVSGLDTSGTAGLATNNSDGTFGYDPNGAFDSLAVGETATDSFKYTVTDGQGGTDTATVSVTISGVNEAPTAVDDDNESTDKAASFTTANVLANDSDTDTSDTLSVSALDTSGTAGLVTNNSDGTFGYDPNGAFDSLIGGASATDTFKYTVTDGQGGTDTATVTVTITGPANVLPVAVDDNAATDEATPTTISVLANDSDSDSGVPDVQAVDTSGTIGTVTNNGSDVDYDPNGQFESLAVGETATDTFKYTMTDGQGGSDTATVTVTISGVNDDPTAVDDIGDSTANSASFTTANVLANDSDSDTSDTLSVSGLDTSGTAGLVSNNSDGTFGYDPNGAFDSLAGGASATDTFKYTVTDGQGGTDTATVTVTIIGPANLPPVAADDNAATDEDTPTTISVLANDTDTDGGTTIVQAIDTSGTTGTVTNNGSDVGYDPNGQFESLAVGETATDTFKYTVTDGHGGSDTATVTVTISGVNDDPTAVDDDAGATDKAAAFTTANVLGNDSDTDSSDTLSVSGLDTSGTAGLVTNNSDGTFGYDPNGAFDGLAVSASATDTFKYTVTDGQGGTNTATVTVTITNGTLPAAPNTVSDLVVWLDADDPATITDTDSDNDVDVWADKSGQVNNASQVLTTSQPEIVAAGINARTAISFDGILDRLDIADDTDINTGGPYTGKTVMMAFRTGSDVASRQVLYEQGGQNRGLNFYIDNDEIYLGGWNLPEDVWGPSFAKAAISANTTYVATFVFDQVAGTVEGFIDGNSIGSVPGASFLNAHLQDIGIGAVNESVRFHDDPLEGILDHAGFFFQGLFGEFVYYNRALTGGEQDSVENYLQNRWQGSANNPPVAIDDTVATDEDTPATISVLANDSDIDGGAPGVQAVDTSGTTGTVTNNGSDVDYDPNGQFESLAVGETATDTFKYTVTDGQGGSDTATVTVTISGVNDDPTAVGDDVDSTDATSSFTTADVLVNDSDLDTSDTLSISGLDTSGTAGLVTNNSDGTFGYDPNGVFESLAVGETATDSFKYTVTDGQGGTDTATVTVTISGVNEAPTAVNDDVGSTANTASFTTANVLVNDSDPDTSDTLSVSALDTSGTAGLVTNNSDGTFGYDPNGAFDSLAGGASTTDTFKYTVTDGQGGTDTATVTVTVTGPANVPPVAVDDNAATDEATPTTISVLANDSDSDGGTTSVQAVDTTGTTGTVTNNGSDVDYDPNGQFESLAVGETATDTFKYTMNDGHGGTDTATVTVTISGANDDPTAVGDDVDSTDAASSFTTANVLVNDSDPDTSDTLSVSGLDTSGTAGLVSNNSDGTFGYDPNGQFVSLAVGETTTDTFKYTVTDGQGGTDTATVTVTVSGVNEAPTAVNDDVGATAHTASFTTANVLVNDSDPDTSDTLSVSGLDTSGTAGLVTNNSDGTFGYDPNGAFDSLAGGASDTDTFKYTVTDGQGGTDTATVTVTVTRANTPPVAVDDNAATDEDTSTTISVVANDSDSDGGAPGVQAVDTSGTIGTVTNNGSDVDYDPNGQFESLAVGETATDTFKYTISDGQGGTDTATVTVTISGANDDPTAVDDDSDSTDKAASFTTANVLVNDSDPDTSDTLSVSALDTSGTAGLVTNNSDGTFGYDPNGAFDSLIEGTSATDTFKYTVTDDQGGTDTATVTVTVTNDFSSTAPNLVNDLVVWLDADDPTTVIDTGSDNDVDVWTDKSGQVNNASQAVAASQPLIAPAGINGRTAINFDGILDRLDIADDTDINSGGPYTGKTVMMAFRTDSDVTSRQVLYEQGGQNRGLNFYIDNGEIYLGGWNLPEDVWGPSFAKAAISANTTYVATFVFDQPAGTVEGFIDGVSIGSVAGASFLNAHAQDIGIGAINESARFHDDPLEGILTFPDFFFFQGLFGEFVYYNRALTSGEQSGVENYLQNRWQGSANNLPDAVDDNAATDEDTPATISVLANDSDSDNGPLSVQAVDTSGTVGTVTNNGSDVDYDPNGQFESLAVGETATDTFKYTVTDGQGGTDTATVTVTISGVNDDPTAVGDNVDSTDATSSFTTADVLVNDSDLDTSDTLSISDLDTSGTAGLVTNNSDGTFGYDPNGVFESLAVGETATDSFKYTVTDGQGGTDTATVTVTISGVNEAPTAVGDNGGSTANSASFTTANVLVNDSDPDTSDTLSVSALDTSGTAGLVTNNSDGTFGYDPNGAFDSLAGGASTTDTFKYTVTDGQGGTDTATVTVTVTGPANVPPVAADDNAATDEATPTTISVLANDSDSDGGTTNVQAVDTSGTTGTVTNNGSDVDYDPNGQFESLAVGETATDTFKYTMNDGHGGTDTATVTVTISGVNDDPTAVGDDVDSTDATSSFTTANVLVNDSDPDTSDTLSVSALDTSGTAGLVSNNSDGTFGYDPNGAFESLAVGETATDSFKYTVTDGQGGTDTATVTVTISGVNDDPTAVGDDVDSTDAASSFTTANVLVNDSDPDTSDTLSVSGLDTSGTAGLVTNNSDGTFGYDPNGAFDSLAGGASDTDTFKYTVTDGQGGTDTATVTVTVTRANTPPVAVDDNAATDEDTSTTISVVANDSDSDGGAPGVQAVDTSGTIGTVTNNGSDVDYDPNGQFESLAVGETATDTFKYTVSDGQGGTDTATVTVTISGANDDPTAVDDDSDSTENAVSFTTANVLVNDSDPDTSDTLSVSGLDTSGTAGLVTNNSDGTFGYDPNGAFDSLIEGTSDTDTFKYTVTDGQGGTDTATVTVTVTNDFSTTAPNSVSDLVVWLDADDPTTIIDTDSDNDVDVWTDKSGQVNDASQTQAASQPLIAPAAMNGRTAISFDGILDRLDIADDTDINSGGPYTGKTVMMAFRTGGDVTTRQVLYEQGGQNRGLNFYIDTGEIYLGGWNLPEDTWGPSFAKTAISTNTTYVATFVFDQVAGTVEGFIDGNSIGSVPGASFLNAHAQNIGIGAVNESVRFHDDPLEGTLTHSGIFFQGLFGEFVYYNRALTGGERSGVENYLQNRWQGLANNLPVAVDDNAATDEDTPATFSVLANDSDSDNGPLGVQAVDTSGTTGTVTNNGSDVDYDPNGQFESLAVGETATDTFKYTITDGQGGTDTATVTVTISGANDNPTAVGENGGSTSGASSFTTANVLVNDSDPDTSDTLSVSGLDTSGTAGLVSNNSDGTFGYDPNGAFDSLTGGASDTDTFKYTVTDGNGGTDTATVTVTITGVNDAPTAVDDDVDSTDATSSFTTANVLANDSDPDASDTLSVSSLDTSGTAGLVSNNSDGTFGYDPNGQFVSLAVGETATDSFKYTVTDGNGGTDTATVTVTISGTNDVPTAVGDNGGSTDEAVSFTTANVLANDSDPDTSDTLSVSALNTSGTAGLVTNNSDGTFGYDPNGAFASLANDFTDTDTFKYTVTDGNGGTDTATVTITITNVIQATVPNSIADLVQWLDADDGGTITDTGGDNDVDVWADKSGQANNASQTVSGSQPLIAAAGINSRTGISFDGVNDRLDIADDATLNTGGPYSAKTLMMAFRTSSDVTSRQVLYEQGGELRGISLYIDQGQLYLNGWNLAQTQWGPSFAQTAITADTTYIATFVHDQASGTVEGFIDGVSIGSVPGVSALHTHNQNIGLGGVDESTRFHDGSFAGDGHFFDGLIGEFVQYNRVLTSEEQIGVETYMQNRWQTPPNTLPVAGDDNAATNENTPTTISVLGNDTDGDGDPFAVQAVDTSGTTGTVTNNGSNVDYDPNSQFESLAVGETTTDTFKYTVSDSQGGTDTATVTVTISGVNDAPTAVDDGGETIFKSSSFTTANVLANDSDPDTSDTLSVSGLDTSGTAGLVSNNSDGTFGYDPNSAFDSLTGGASATDTFKYTVTDGQGGTDTATVTVTIISQRLPIAGDDNTSTNEDTPTTISVLGNDTDEDGDTLTVQVVDTSGTVGTVTNNGSDVDYDPNGQFESLAVGETTTDSFKYTVTDGQFGTDTATVTVTISGVNDAPTATDDDGGAIDAASSFTTANVLANDSDPDTSDTLSVSGLDTSGTAGLVSNNSDGTFSYDPNGAFDSLIEGTSATDTFKYTVTDGQGGTDTATVTVTVTNITPLTSPDSVADLVMWLDADDGATITDNDNDDDVDVWADKSVEGNDASQAVSAEQPLIVAAAIKNRTAIDFDGVDDRLDVADDATLNSGGPYAAKTLMMAFRTGSDVTSRQVLYEQGGQTRGISFYIDQGQIYLNGWNLAETAWGPSFAQAAVTANTTYVATFVHDQAAGTVEGFIDGVSIGSVSNVSFLNGHVQDIGIGGVNESARFHDGSFTGAGHYFDGMIGEFIQYNRALTSGELSDLETYMQTRWTNALNVPPVANDDVASTGINQAKIVSVLDNDTDANFLDVLTVTNASGATNGTVSILANTKVTYTPNGGFSGTDTFTYTIDDGNGGTDTATVTVSVTATPSPDQFDGLALWLDADDAATITESSGSVSAWQDKSGNGRDYSQAVAASRPTLTASLLNGLPGIQTDGIDDYLEANLTGFSLNGMTLFMVAKVDQTNADSGIFNFYDDTALHDTQDEDAFSLRSDGDNGGVSLSRRLDDGNPLDLAGLDAGTTPAILVAALAAATGKLEVNGGTDVVDSYGDTNAIDPTDGTLGARWINGAISGTEFGANDFFEVLVYDRVMTNTEINDVNNYLSTKWGVVTTQSDVDYEFVPFAGQSNAESHFTTSGGQGINQFLNDLSGFTAADSVTSLNTAAGASAVDRRAVQTTATDNYWWDLDAGQPGPLLTAAVADIKAHGVTPTGVVWAQGEQDAKSLAGLVTNPPTTVDRYKQATEDVFDYFRSELGIPDLAFYIQQIGPETAADRHAAHHLIREAQTEMAAALPDVHIAALSYDQDLVDSVHFAGAGYAVLGSRLARFIADEQGEAGVTYGSGPTMLSAAGQSGNTEVVVTLQHAAGTDFTPATLIDGFLVEDSLGTVTVNSVARQSATEIILTLNTALSGASQVSYINGVAAWDNTDIVTDNAAPLTLPLAPDSLDILLA